MTTNGWDVLSNEEVFVYLQACGGIAFKNGQKYTSVIVVYLHLDFAR